MLYEMKAFLLHFVHGVVFFYFGSLFILSHHPSNPFFAFVPLKKNPCEKHKKKMETFATDKVFPVKKMKSFLFFFCLQRKTFLLPTIYEFVKLFLLFGNFLFCSLLFFFLYIFWFLKMMRKWKEKKGKRKKKKFPLL